MGRLYCESVGELWFDEEADAALADLERDSNRTALNEAVQRVLFQLASDPGDRSVRKVRFQEPKLWCVTVFAGNEGWAVLWEPHPGVDGDVIVQYIGPSTFR